MNQINNSITLIGRLGQDPQFLTTQSGQSVVNLSLATHDYYRNKEGEKISTTEWHRCVAWGKTAEIINAICKKGKQVALRGRLTYNSYEGKDGLRRTIPQIVVSEFTLLGGDQQ